MQQYNMSINILGNIRINIRINWIENLKIIIYKW